MKKFFIFLFAFLLPLSARATCATGYTQITLDPDVEPTTYTYDKANKTWDVTAPYGHLSGIAVCNSTSGSWATASGTDFPTGTSGVYCWCKMLRPARSAWVFFNGYASDCASRCADACAYAVRFHSDFRDGLFNSVTGDACVPNTISINWQNAAGSTANTTTCTYDEALVTPTANPTKRGHVFTGWVYQ